jgi:hypothetical protein
MLNNVPSYYALSYTWGASLHSDAEYTENDKVPIQLDGKLVKIFPNLYHALLQCHKYIGVFGAVFACRNDVAYLLSSTHDKHARIWLDMRLLA